MAKRLVPLCVSGVATNVADNCKGDRRDSLTVILIDSSGYFVLERSWV